MRFALLVLFVGTICACDGSPEAASTASAKATATAAAPPKPTLAPTASASAEASGGTPVLPGTPLKDALRDTASIMGLGKASGPMGVMASDKKDVAALLAAIGTDQQLSKPFGPKCVTTTKLAFQTKDGKQLGVLGFCDKDESFAKGVFDGSGAEQAAVDVKDPAGFKAALKKIGAIKK